LLYLVLQNFSEEEYLGATTKKLVHANIRCNGHGVGQGSYFAGKQNHHPQPPKHPEGESVDKNGFSDGEPLLSLGYGPGYDAPKELASPVAQLCMDTRSRSATDILQALQRVKQSIQVSSCPKNVLNTGMREYNRLKYCSILEPS
jgi:hypothetical protein